MESKIRVPRLRTFLLTMVGLLVFLLFILHHGAQREVANQKATGLGAVATGWDPISLWKENSFLSAARRGVGLAGGIVGGVPGGLEGERIRVAAYLTADQQEQSTSKKFVQSAGLQLLVRDARDTAAAIQQIVVDVHGEIEKADIRDYAGSPREGEMVLRVPASELEVTISKFRKLAIRVQSEHHESRDITREYVDCAARLRNMKAEEEQYLVLLRRAGSMKDTLEVTEKVSEVRGEIERMQGELNWWSHQVAMSAVQIQLTEEPQATMLARWRPIYNARNSSSAMLSGLGEWVDWVVALIINIPLILVWFASIVGLLVLAWKTLRWIWRRFFTSPAPASAS